MNNKYAVYTIFSILSLIMLGVILLHLTSIKSDIYALLNLQVGPKEKAVIETIEKNLSRNVYFLSKDFDNLEYLKGLNQSFEIFEEINIKAEQNTDIAKE